MARAITGRARVSRRAAAIAAVALVVGLGFWGAAAARNDDPAAQGQPSPSPRSDRPAGSADGAPKTQAPTPLPEGETPSTPDRESASPPRGGAEPEIADSVNRLLRGTVRALAAPRFDVATGATATGSALGAIKAQRSEFRQNKWRQTGVPIVVSLREVKHTAQTVVVEACIDSSDVKVVDGRGQTVPLGARPERSRHVYTLRSVGGRYVVAEESFARKPVC